MRYKVTVNLHVFVMAQPDDVFSKKQKYVASHCKQKGICLPMKLFRMSEKVCLIHIAQHCQDATHQHYKSRPLPTPPAKSMASCRGLGNDH